MTVRHPSDELTMCDNRSVMGSRYDFCRYKTKVKYEPATGYSITFYDEDPLTGVKKPIKGTCGTWDTVVKLNAYFTLQN